MNIFGQPRRGASLPEYPPTAYTNTSPYGYFQAPPVHYQAPPVPYHTLPAHYPAPQAHLPGVREEPTRRKARSTRGIEVSTDILRAAAVISGALEARENSRKSRYLPVPAYEKLLPNRVSHQHVMRARNLAMPAAKVAGAFLLLQKIEKALVDRTVRRAQLEYMADTSHRGPRGIDYSLGV